MPTTSSHTFPTLSYRKFGSGPAVVLLHGFPEDGALWEPVWPALANACTIIVPDLPGSGGSTFTKDDLTIEEMAESVKAIMDAEGIGKAVVAGHSMGGYTALALADLYPGVISGLSLVHSTATADSEEKKQNRQKAINLIQKGGKEPFIRQSILNLFADDFVKANPQVIEKQVEKGLKLGDDGMIGFYNAMMHRPERKFVLEQASYPVQWIIGKDDNLLPYDKLLQQSYLSSVNFVSVYKNCGHMSMIEKPQMLIEDLKTFIAYCYRVV